MKNSTKIIGLLALGFTGTFLYKFAKEKNTSMNQAVEGLQVNINPERIVDGLVTMSGVDERYKEGLSTIGKLAVKKLRK